MSASTTSIEFSRFGRPTGPKSIIVERSAFPQTDHNIRYMFCIQGNPSGAQIAFIEAKLERYVNFEHDRYSLFTNAELKAFSNYDKYVELPIDPCDAFEEQQLNALNGSVKVLSKFTFW